MRPLRVLTFTSVFPNPAQPRHGVPVWERLRHMVESGAVAARVLAPVPWFPVSHRMFGSWAKFASIPSAEAREGIAVMHPRYPVIPKIGMGLAPWLMASAVRRLFRELASDADLVDAQFLYPDGVAAVLLAQEIRKPVVLTARGSDVNQFPEFAIPRRWLQWAVPRADHVFAVSVALAERLTALGAPADRLSVSVNGVDLAKFKPCPRQDARARLGWSQEGTVLLSVGNLLELKGHHLLVDAVADLPNVRLVIIGEGPFRGALERRIREKGVADRVALPGQVPHEALADHYCAADLTLLASSREGTPNVLLESLSCGTPVVATAIGGIPDVVNAPAAGRLAAERSAAAFRSAIVEQLRAPPARADTRRFAERFAWPPVIERQLAIWRQVVGSYVADAAGPRESEHAR